MAPAKMQDELNENSVMIPARIETVCQEEDNKKREEKEKWVVLLHFRFCSWERLLFPDKRFILSAPSSIILLVHWLHSLSSPASRTKDQSQLIVLILRDHSESQDQWQGQAPGDPSPTEIFLFWLKYPLSFALKPPDVRLETVVCSDLLPEAEQMSLKDLATHKDRPVCL